MALTGNRTQSDQAGVSLHEMIRVYDACIQVREISKQQLDLSDDMALTAINAEIAAAKSVLNREAFIVLANETGKIARQMSAHVASILQDANQLAQDSLAGLQRTRRLKQFQAGKELLRNPLNGERLTEVMGGLESVIAGVYTGILGRLDHIEAGREAIAKLIVKVSRIITYFRIEASRDAQYGAYFQHIADGLANLCQTANKVSGQMGGILADARHA